MSDKLQLVAILATKMKERVIKPGVSTPGRIEEIFASRRDD